MMDGHEQERIRLAVEDALNGIVEAAQRLEDEIGRRGIQHKYVAKLFTVMDWAVELGDEDGSDAFISTSSIWAALRATPDQRARAFLAATE